MHVFVQVLLDTPLLIEEELEEIKTVTGLKCETFSLYFDVKDENSMREAIGKLCADVEKAVNNGCEVVILSDKSTAAERSAQRPPIPALLAVGAVHHHAIKCARLLMSAFVSVHL